MKHADQLQYISIDFHQAIVLDAKLGDWFSGFELIIHVAYAATASMSYSAVFWGAVQVEEDAISP